MQKGKKEFDRWPQEFLLTYTCLCTPKKAERFKKDALIFDLLLYSNQWRAMVHGANGAGHAPFSVAWHTE